MGQAETTAHHFDAILYPNQSLSPRAARLILLVTATVALLIGLFFVTIGAWPIAGFFGLDVALLVLAFRAVRRNATHSERVRLNDRDLVVEATNARGQQRRWRFEPYWVRVHMDDPPKRSSLVTLRSHGTTLKLGAFLTPDERLSFAKALQNALSRWH